MFSSFAFLKGPMRQLIINNIKTPSAKILTQNVGNSSMLVVPALHPAYIHLSSMDTNNIKSLSSANQDNELDKLYRLIEVEVRGNDPAVLKSYSWFATTAAQHLGIEIGKCWTPRKPHHERYTLLRSIHVNKKCRVQYEFRTYFHFMQFHRLTGSTSDTFLEYIQRNLPEGVAMKVSKVALEQLPEHILPPSKQIHQKQLE